MKFIKSFFQSLSVTEPSAIKECSWIENAIQSILGLQILLTATFAFISFTFALSFFIDSYIVIGLIGIAWFLVILNIDRILLIALQSQVSESEDITKIVKFFTFFLRVLLAGFITTIISIPIEIKVFEYEIADEIKLQNQLTIESISNEKVKELEELRTTYEEKSKVLDHPIYISQLEKVETLRQFAANINPKKRTIPSFTEIGDTIFQGSREIPTLEYSEAKSNIKTAEIALEKTKTELLKSNEQATIEYESDVNELEMLYEYKLAALKNPATLIEKLEKRLIARIDALYSVRRNNPRYNRMGWMIWLLILFIEILPTGLKLILKNSKYQRLIEQQHNM